ncbi:MAG: FkbM family methyltransferase [Chloroflexi bacterium]|nr:FkbM family methyltransferase [Chloroflexota bacterium]
MSTPWKRLLALLEDPGALRAWLSWPKFSFTAYRMCTRLARQDVRPRTVLDVGANVGQFAVAAAHIFPGVQVISFEPEPASFARLQGNIRRLPQVEAHALAVGDLPGQVEFHVNAYSPSSSILPLGETHRQAFPFAREADLIRVTQVRLDDFLAGREFRPPVLMKIDVQGYEDHVLRGAARTLACSDYVLMETSFSPLYQGEQAFRQVLERMEALGFSFLRPLDFVDHPHTGEILQMDALFRRLPPG